MKKDQRITIDENFIYLGTSEVGRLEAQMELLKGLAWYGGISEA